MNAHAHTKLPAREALRAAISVRDEAAARVREAAATLARAGRLATDAQRRLDVLGDVDGQVLAHATAAYRTFAESGGDRPDAGTPAHLVERQRQRDAARQELAAAEAARSQLTEEHAATQGEHERHEREVAAAADAVIAEMALLAWGRYVQAIEAARAAWDDAASICGMTANSPAAMGRAEDVAGATPRPRRGRRPGLRPPRRAAPGRARRRPPLGGLGGPAAPAAAGPGRGAPMMTTCQAPAGRAIVL